MKTAAQIRRHVDNLRRALEATCDCAANGHSLECQQGARYIDVSISVLEWALGENAEYQQKIVDVAEEERRKRRS